MNKLRTITILCAAASAMAQALAAIPMRSTVVSDIAQYVYPANKAPEVSLSFTPDGNGYVRRSDDGKRLTICRLSDDSEVDTIFDIDHTRETVIADFEGFQLSPDATKILLWRMSEPLYRRSKTAEYYVYEVRTRLLRPLSKQFARQRDPLFSPDSRMVAFVADGNIYCAKLDYQTEIAVTTDGSADGILNGITDWTYEEEFGITSAMAWAPDNLTLCFLTFDQQHVPCYTLPIYRGACNARDDYELYPGTLSYRYPVAGSPNSKVSLHSYDVETRKTKSVDIPDDPEYIPRLAYGPSPEKLMVTTLNRDQNRMEIFCVNPKSTVCRSVYVRQSDAWIEPLCYEALWYGDDSFVVASDADGFMRFYRYSYAGADMGALSTEGVDATAFYGIDGSGNAFFQVAEPTPRDRTLCRRDKRGAVTVISAADGTTSASFAPGMSYMLVCYSDADTPPVYTLCKADGSSLRTVLDNAAYVARVKPLKKAKEFFSFDAGGTTLNGFIIKPDGFDSSRSYPLIMTQYSGPGSQSVLNRWSLDWEDYMAANGYIVACVDGRGTAGRGTAFRTCVYRDLGHYETVDQLSAARYLASLPYVDASRVGICGWSYGGYETLMAASADDAPFKAAVAIAPVTDWRFYDTVYTERYMLTPGQNSSGYDSASALQRASSLSCPLLLMFGTLDDNVHPANSLEYVARLQAYGIFADMFVFPNMNHSINGCNARAVVYGRMCQFFMDELK